MPTYYTVVQYVPDPVIDERMNIGVIVFGDGRLRARFLENWHRVRSFGGENISFIRTFVKDLDRMGEEDIRRVAETWQHSIQLTKPAGSLLTADKLLVDVSSRYLRGLTPPEKTYRSRQEAVALTRRRVKEALDLRLGKEGRQLIKVDYQIQGKFGSHEFDVGAGNGRPFFAARALSFEKPEESKALAREIEATAFAVSDVRKEEESIPLGVVVLPPKKENRDTYLAAVHVFRAVEAQVIEEVFLNEWADEMAEKVNVEWIRE